MMILRNVDQSLVYLDNLMVWMRSDGTCFFFLLETEKKAHGLDRRWRSEGKTQITCQITGCSCCTHDGSDTSILWMLSCWQNVR